MTPCFWRILCLRTSSCVPYFRQPPNLPTAARRNRKCTECGTTAFSRNRMSAESAHLSTFGAETETEAEIRSTSKRNILFTLFSSLKFNLLHFSFVACYVLDSVTSECISHANQCSVLLFCNSLFWSCLVD